MAMAFLWPLPLGPPLMARGIPNYTQEANKYVHRNDGLWCGTSPEAAESSGGVGGLQRWELTETTLIVTKGLTTADHAARIWSVYTSSTTRAQAEHKCRPPHYHYKRRSQWASSDPFLTPKRQATHPSPPQHHRSCTELRKIDHSSMI